MKSIIFTGIILLLASVGLFYLFADSFDVKGLETSHVIGMMSGVGVGLIIGGIVGYVSKGTAIKEAKKKAELKKLRKEKEALEKKSAEQKDITKKLNNFS